MMALRAWPAAPKTSAPALTRSWRSSAADKAGVPLEKVEVALGDTTLPEGPTSGGSMATGSVIPAVFAAADKAIEALLTVATTHRRIGLREAQDRRTCLRRRPSICEGEWPCEWRTLRGSASRANLHLATGSGKSEATFGEKKPKFSTHSFGCHFVEVTWQPEIARLRVHRVVTVIDAGRIINPLAGRNRSKELW